MVPAPIDQPCWEIALKSATGQYLWFDKYCEQFELDWYDPSFVPMKGNKYELDLNHDGKPEIGLAVWEGGNSPHPRWAIIFTVEKNSLKPFRRKKYQIGSNDPLLP